MASTPYHYLFKFVLVGDSGVGKSCILLRFIKDKFLDKHELTLGASYDTSILEIHNKTIKLQIWDTAGQEAYLSVTRAYYRGAIAAFLVFDVANQSTFDNVKDWVKQLRVSSNQHISIALLGNKIDLPQSQREVSQQSAKQFANQHKFVGYYEVSALSGENVKEPFRQLAASVLHKIESKAINLGVEQYNGIKIGNKCEEVQVRQDRRSKALQSRKKEKSYCC